MESQTLGPCVRSPSAWITHLPTGISAYSDTKSQAQNKKMAFAVLKARLFSRDDIRNTSKRNKVRKKQLGTGMRADKIRTVAEQLCGWAPPE